MIPWDAAELDEVARRLAVHALIVLETEIDDHVEEWIEGDVEPSSECRSRIMGLALKALLDELS